MDILKNVNKKLIALSSGIVVVFLSALLLLLNNAHTGSFTENVQPLPEHVQLQQIDKLSYAGENGKDALTLLKEHATVGFAQPGMVNSINGRKALDSKHEYWAFYVNGKMAQVGAADFQTKNTDQIMWKIETY
jgi:hypothetical protein